MLASSVDRDVNGGPIGIKPIVYIFYILLVGV